MADESMADESMADEFKVEESMADNTIPWRMAYVYTLYIYYWGERERAPSCGLNGRAVMYDNYIYMYMSVRSPLLRMRGATRKRSRPDRESSQSS